MNCTLGVKRAWAWYELPSVSVLWRPWRPWGFPSAHMHALTHIKANMHMLECVLWSPLTCHGTCHQLISLQNWMLPYIHTTVTSLMHVYKRSNDLNGCAEDAAWINIESHHWRYWRCLIFATSRLNRLLLASISRDRWSLIVSRLAVKTCVCLSVWVYPCECASVFLDNIPDPRSVSDV